ncbi:T9SS type A sorting domain-containing protein [Marivirga harenae]|uniref:T9SS type A sorting domain-containing protein n=1 Tax=Marivirga harenae TaxID=2010992 RepID=UPI0026E0AD13|nr:T9SS type A sorting domain-containing protein [Marivirga harenae]WKV12736.1 T9SS type A sorting domain-containing protein [Marivirga harenae]
MENIILQKTRYLKALMLTMLVGFFAFGASAQTWDATTVPPSPQYANQEATVTYEASTFPAGTTFILWDDAINNDIIDPDETIFGTATAQGAATDIDFVWPDNAVRLKLGGFSGDAVQGEIIPIDNGDVTFVGTNDNFFPFDFDRASARSLTTTAYDVDSSDPVVLTIDVDDFGLDVDNPLEVLFSTDGFATAGTALTEDGSGVEEFDFGGTYTFTLPSGAKSPNTSFRIQQKGTVDYGQGKAWEVNFANIEIGETYTLENPPGVGVNQFTTILTPQLDITDIFNTDNVSFGNIYPGEDVTIEAQLQNADLTGLEFAATITNNDGQVYLLENQNVTVDNGTKEIEIVGDVPTDIIYDNFNTWDLDIYAYEGSEILFGVSEFYDFTAGLPVDFEQIGGFQDGDGLTFEDAGERSLTTTPYAITNTDGLLIFTIARVDNVLSPVGTDIIVEYSTDGENYTELTSIALNSLSTSGTKDTLDAWPAGVVSSSTQFRFRQEGNNGEELDVYKIEDLEIQSNSNLVSESLIGRASATEAVSVFSPFISVDNINVGGDGQAFPMEDYEITYSIDNGTFPNNTPATAYLQRTGQPDIIIGETTNVNGESIDFTVPPIEAGDYNIYFRTLNEQQYGTPNLAVYDIGLEISEVTYSDPVLVAGDEFTYAGSAITANYTIQGTPGAGAELMMSVFDNNPDVNDWVMIGSTTTLDGAITATLPLGINYNVSPNVRVSLGSGGVYTEDFSENIFNEYFYNAPFSTELIESTQGTSDDVRPDEFASSSVRSATSVPFDFTYGGSLNNFDLYTSANFTGNFDVKIQGSIDGSTWEDLDEVTFTSIFQTRTFNLNIPNELWSETFQFRIIYNEDEAFAAGENVVKFYNASINRPTFLEVVQDDAPFSLIRPSLAVSDYDKTAFVMGEEVSINYNAVGFPASTEYAAVIEQAGEFYVAGTSPAEDASSITAIMPIAFQNSGNNYLLTVVPFEPATAGGDYKQGETVQIDNEEDFLVISGQDPGWASSYSIFDFDQIGDRELLTKAYDLSGTSSATLNFNFNNTFGYGTIDVNANKNTVPRLEISTDGGATFQLIPVYELEEGEEQIYDDGLLYLQQGYSVDLPAAAFTEATHFRFSQPLNLGENANRWSVANISLTLNDDNRLPDYQFDDNINGNNPLNPITITDPSLNNYDWMQADLDDAVFNGETFDYSWDLAEGFNASDVDAFPAGTSFTFYLEESGDYVINPDTGMPYVLGSTTSLGTFEAEVPFFVVNGNYNVRLAASIEIEGENGPEDYYFYGDEETGTDVGDLDVFLRAAKLVYQGDENANIYAGQDVEFAIQLENDETNNAPTADLFANLLLETNEGDYLLAAQQGLGNIMATLPTWFNGNANFKLQLTENEAVGDVGTIINDSELENLEANVNNFTSELFSDYVEAEMNGNAQMVQTRKFSKEEFSDIWDIEWDYNFSNITGTTNVKFQYSIDDGESWSTLENNNYSDGFYNEVYGGLLSVGVQNVMEQNGFILRWIQESPEGEFNVDDLDINFSGQSFDDTNLEVYPANFTIGNATKSDIDFDNTSGRRLVTTRTFTVEELENTTSFGFDLSFDQLPGDLTADQYVIFEYSTDGGATYTEMQQYPEMDADMTLVGERFLYAVSTDMKENGVKFRWRQEENKGNVTLDNLSFLFGETIPFDYINASEFINQQAFLITSIPSEACISDEITVSYEIRGRLGENDFIKISYSDAFGSSNELSPEFMADGTTGDFVFELPSDAVNAGVNNQMLKFELEGNVETQNAGSFIQINGTETEESTEIVAPLNTEASFTVNDPLACETEDTMVELDNADLQDYFMYEILDAADGTVLGSLTRDPEMPENMINIGQITATTDLELRVTAMSSAGTVCNTLITDEETVEVLQNFELYSYANPDQNWKLVETGASLNSCNAAGEIQLSVRRLLENGSTTAGGTTLVEWFRDNLNNLVSTNGSIDDSDMEMSGEYFARVTTGTCVYTTERIQINLEPTPDQPTVTVVSGDLAACTSADPVVLEAPEGFEYYLWSNGKTSRSISVEDQGSYSVQVSNLPFGIGCTSPSSSAVDVDRYEVPEFSVRNEDTNEIIGAGEEILVCEDFDIELLEDGNQSNSGVVQILRDGADYAVVEAGTSEFTIDESGTYSLVWNFDAINVTECSATSNEFVVTIVEAPTASPALTATGDLTFCEGQGTVVLTAAEGFEYYRWRRNGGTITNSNQGQTNSNALEVSTGGTYTVEVGNAAGCWSPESNAIAVNVIAEPNLPNGFFQVNTTCGEGAAEFNITNNNNGGSAMIYQLYNGETGEASGNPVTVQSGQSGSIFTDVLTEDGIPFYVEVMYADGTGCSFVDPAITTDATVRTITLEVQGALLSAEYPTGGVSDIRWLRDGVLLTNADDSEITISDAAEYVVEVEYNDGCIISASSADIAGKVLGNNDAMAMKVVSYPNPAQADVTLNVNSQYMGRHEVIITSMTGQVMMQSSFEKSSFEAEHAMDVANLEEGIYNVQIRHDGLTQNVRIIKK